MGFTPSIFRSMKQEIKHLKDQLNGKRTQEERVKGEIFENQKQENNCRTRLTKLTMEINKLKAVRQLNVHRESVPRFSKYNACADVSRFSKLNTCAGGKCCTLVDFIPRTDPQ